MAVAAACSNEELEVERDGREAGEKQERGALYVESGLHQRRAAGRR